jgi:PAS domain S-box-containing protein
MMWADTASKLTEHASKAIRTALAIVPVIATMYSFMATSSSALPIDSTDRAWIVLLICAVWLGIGALIFRQQGEKRLFFLLLIVTYHVLAWLYVVTAAGSMVTPFISIWSVIALSMYLLYSWRGFSLSMLILLAAYLALLNATSTTNTIAGYYALWFLIVLALSGMLSILLRSIAYDQVQVDHYVRQASLQHDRVMALINNLTDAVISTDIDGKIVEYNAAALNLLNTNAQLQRQPIDCALKLHDREAHVVLFSEELRKTTTVASRDDLSIVADNETIRLEITYSPIRGNYSDSSVPELSGYVIILRDITREKSLEEERDEFISVISHELRTPVAIAEGTIANAQMMVSRDDIPKEKLVRSIDMAHEQVIFLAKMVNDLSTLSRAERGVGADMETIDLDELVQGLYQEHLEEAGEKQLALDLHMPGKLGRVTTSRLYLKELLQNFITNAIKYTKEGSVTISASRTERGIRLAVKDTGIGISKSDQKHVYDKFYRAEDYRTRETSGTGLGLYVAAKLAHKLGTKIELSSHLNHGSEFSIFLNDPKKLDS